MDIKKLVIISLIAVAVIASVSVVSAGLLDEILGGGQAQDNVIEIGNITFNSTNISGFKLHESGDDYGGYWEWYIDENDTGYNVNIFNCSNLDDLEFNESLKEYELDTKNDSTSSETIDGIVVYTTAANEGDNIGDTRYVAYIVDNDLKTIVDICTPDPNETAKMASTLKFNK